MEVSMSNCLYPGFQLSICISVVAKVFRGRHIYGLKGRVYLVPVHPFLNPTWWIVIISDNKKNNVSHLQEKQKHQKQANPSQGKTQTRDNIFRVSGLHQLSDTVSCVICFCECSTCWTWSLCVTWAAWRSTTASPSLCFTCTRRRSRPASAHSSRSVLPSPPAGRSVDYTFSDSVAAMACNA